MFSKIQYKKQTLFLSKIIIYHIKLLYIKIKCIFPKENKLYQCQINFNTLIVNHINKQVLFKTLVLIFQVKIAKITNKKIIINKFRIVRNYKIN